MHAPGLRIGRRRVAEVAAHAERSVEEVHQWDELRCGQTFQDLYVLIHLLDSLLMGRRRLRPRAPLREPANEWQTKTKAQDYELEPLRLSMSHDVAFPLLK